MKKIIYYSLISLPVLVVFLPSSVFGADFFFETNHSLYGVNDTIVVDVLLQTDETVNTISGSVRVDTIKDIKISVSQGGSSILFWVDKPRVENNIVSFSGITPGGLEGSALYLFSITLQGQSLDDVVDLSVDDGIVLLHDGNGTEIKTNFIPKKVYISEDSTFSQEINNPIDVEKPEDFKPIIVQDENLYDGKNVLVFATQDKGTGVIEYKIKEGYFGIYKPAVSPYLVQDQKLFKRIFVKAVDGAGNERVVIVHPQKKIFDENFILISSILIITISIYLSVFLKKRR